MHDTGKILLGLGVFGALVTGPVWYGLGRGPARIESCATGEECTRSTRSFGADGLN